MQKKCNLYLFYLVLWNLKLSFGFNLFPKNQELIYEYLGQVIIGVLPANAEEETIKNNQWSIDGQIILQRSEGDFIIVKFTPKKGKYSERTQPLLHRRLDILQEPFKINLMNNVVTTIQFQPNEPGWVMNFKKSIASAFLIHGENTGAFVMSEVGIMYFFLSKQLFICYYFGYRVD